MRTSFLVTQLNEHVRTQVLTPQCPHLFNATTYETTHLLLHVLIYLQFRRSNSKGAVGRICRKGRFQAWNERVRGEGTTNNNKYDC